MSRLSKVPKSERAAVIDRTDELFAQRTGVTRRLDPARDRALVKKWLSICDEVIASRGAAANAAGVTSTVNNAATRAAEALSGAVSSLVNPVPQWVLVARSQIGVKESPGKAINPKIMEYVLTCTQNFAASGYSWANKRDWKKWVEKKRAAGINIPMKKPTNLLKYFLDGEGRGANDEGFYWCAAFVNWCLKRSDVTGTNHGSVPRWKTWGERLDEPVQGAIMIMPRGSTSWGHIAFVDQIDGKWRMLGGNQKAAGGGGGSNQVSSQRLPKNVTAYIWPSGIPRV